MKKTIALGVLLALVTVGSTVLASSPSTTWLAQNNSATATSTEANLVKRKKKSNTRRAQLSRNRLMKRTAVARRTTIRPTALRAAIATKKTALRPVVAKRRTALKTIAPRAQESLNTNNSNDGVSLPQMSNSSAGATQTVTTTVEKAAPKAKPSKWKFKYRSNNAINLNALESPGDGALDHEVAAWDRVNVDYKLTENVSLDVMPQFYHTWFGNRDRAQSTSIMGLQQPYAGYMGETGFGVLDSKLAHFIGGLNLDGYTGWFIPSNEVEQKGGTYGEWRTNSGLGRSFGKLDVKWIESLWYYFNQYETSTLLDDKGLPVLNVNYLLWNLIDVTYNFSKKFYFDFTFGTVNQATQADTNPGTARPAQLDDYYVLDPEFGYAFTKHFMLEVGLWEFPDMRTQSKTYVPFDGSTGNTQAYFQTTVTF